MSVKCIMVRLISLFLVVSVSGFSAPSSDLAQLKGLRVAVVGAGPSGLLLSHRLLKAGASVRIFEGRKDPRATDIALDGRAYALGIGCRGRTAIRSVDNGLWDAIKSRGYESERFTLYINSFPIKLRDGTNDASSLEPSVLMYQSDLCSVLLDELCKKANSAKNLKVEFDQKVSGFGLDKKVMIGNKSATGPFDLIVGCDGVFSSIRSSMDNLNEKFESELEELPGEFKVCRVDDAAEKIDPTSVALIIPKGGSTTAFVEPTARGSCILFAGNSDNDPILQPTSNLTETTAALEERFPLLAGLNFDNVADQLANQPMGKASSVKCNVYHSNGFAALVGDSAHATGGVSGQGVNSALVDSMTLADCVEELYDQNDREASIEAALLKYSQMQLPEGKALYDLSFGPKPKGFIKAGRLLAKNFLDTVFQGRLGIGEPPLQTMLTTTTVPFADIRRGRDFYYDEPFPTQASFETSLAELSNGING